jgi:hypothetical protein
VINEVHQIQDGSSELMLESGPLSCGKIPLSCTQFEVLKYQQCVGSKWGTTWRGKAGRHAPEDTSRRSFHQRGAMCTDICGELDV